LNFFGLDSTALLLVTVLAVPMAWLSVQGSWCLLENTLVVHERLYQQV